MQCISLSDSILTMGPCADTASFVRIVALGDTNSAYRLELDFRVLDAPEKSTRSGLALGAWIWNGGTNQQFRLEASPESGGRAHRLKMVHSGLYLHPVGTSLLQVAMTAGSGYDWELIKGSVEPPTGLPVPPPAAAPRRDRSLIDALGRRFPGSRDGIRPATLGIFPSP
jgi:hypothetical protein